MNTIDQLIADNPTATDAEVADLHNAQLPVYRRVPTAEVRDLLTARRLNAPLRFARDNPDVPIALRGGVIEFLATLNGFEFLDATDERNRTEAMQVAGGLAQAGVITPADAEAFTALLVDAEFAAVTAEQVAARRAVLARQADVVAVRARVQAYLNDVLNPAEADPAKPLVTPEQHFAGGV